MPSGSSLKFMMDKMPDRAFDVGICEQHAVTLSAGMATQGMKVFCNIYSSFMQRAYDQVVHDVAIQNLPVIFCLDRAGLVGEDGPTHHGAYDIAYMRCIPNMIVSAPMNESELRNLMYTAQLDSTTHPFVIRYPRGEGVMPEWRTPFEEIKIGKGEIERRKRYCHSFVWTSRKFCSCCHPRIEERKVLILRIMICVLQNHWMKTLLHEVFNKYDKIITVEDGTVVGGFGAAILEFMATHNYTAKMVVLGIPDRIVEHGSPKELHKECGYDAAAIKAAVIKMMQEEKAV